MPDLPPTSNSLDTEAIDSTLQQQIQRLYQFILYMRWLKVGFLWLTVAPLSLWGMRHEFPLWFDYFTWTAVRYSLIYNPLSALGLGFCVGLTLSTLIWQSSNALFGISPSYLRYLEKRVLKIRQRRPGDWLRKQICQPRDANSLKSGY
jgi:hypothetical protein